MEGHHEEEAFAERQDVLPEKNEPSIATGEKSHPKMPDRDQSLTKPIVIEGNIEQPEVAEKKAKLPDRDQSLTKPILLHGNIQPSQ